MEHVDVMFFLLAEPEPTGAISIEQVLLKRNLLSHGGACGSGADVFLGDNSLYRSS
jgi:hypothetical protein